MSWNRRWKSSYQFQLGDLSLMAAAMRSARKPELTAKSTAHGLPHRSVREPKRPPGAGRTGQSLLSIVLGPGREGARHLLFRLQSADSYARTGPGGGGGGGGGVSWTRASRRWRSVRGGGGAGRRVVREVGARVPRGRGVDRATGLHMDSEGGGLDAGPGPSAGRSAGEPRSRRSGGPSLSAGRNRAGTG